MRLKVRYRSGQNPGVSSVTGNGYRRAHLFVLSRSQESKIRAQIAPNDRDAIYVDVLSQFQPPDGGLNVERKLLRIRTPARICIDRPSSLLSTGAVAAQIKRQGGKA